VINGDCKLKTIGLNSRVWNKRGPRAKLKAGESAIKTITGNRLINSLRITVMKVINEVIAASNEDIIFSKLLSIII